MRLVAFGCSHTYGAFLPDCIDDTSLYAGKSPSKYAWPQLLANELQLECINNAICGASNKEIWHKAINFDYQKNDIVVILWSYIARHCKMISTNTEQYLPAIDTENSNLYYEKFYTEYDAINDTFLRLEHLGKYLEDKGLMVGHLLVECPENINDLKWITAKFYDPNFWNIVRNNPLAADQKHPGAKAHQQIATIVKRYLRL